MVHTPGNQLEVVLASITSGMPVVVGKVPGVALTSSETTTNKVTVQTDGVFTLSVKAINATVGDAVAAGDILYYVAADTPKLSKKPAGVRFGYALEAVAESATGTIKVKVGY
jgi:predicted RecA/RadA family phage recombinase